MPTSERVGHALAWTLGRVFDFLKVLAKKEKKSESSGCAGCPIDRRETCFGFGERSESIVGRDRSILIQLQQ